jgi:LysM repeat protein
MIKNLIRSKQLFFVLFVYFLNVSSSIGQTVNTNNKTAFSLHQVKPKETIYSVSSMFNLNADELIELNPELKQKGIQLGMFLKVPVVNMGQANQIKKGTVNNENQITPKIDNLREVNFEPFPIFQEAIKKDEQAKSRNKSQHWKGELFIKEGLIFVPKSSNGGQHWQLDGFSVYDVNKMQYGTIEYLDGTNSNTSKLSSLNILRPNFDENSFFTFRNSKVYKSSYFVEDYSKFEYYNYPRYNNGQWSYYSPDIFCEFSKIDTYVEIEENNKIYRFQITKNTLTGDQSYFFDIDKNGNYAMSSKAVEVQNHNGYVYIELFNSSKAIINMKMINVNNIIENTDMPNMINKGYGVVETKVGRNAYTWDIDSMDYLNNGNVLLNINLYQQYKVHYPTSLPLASSHKYQLTVILNPKLQLVKYNFIVDADYKLFSKNSNDFFEIISEGGKIICYDENLNIKWYKELATEAQKSVGQISYYKQINNNLYLMGTATNKYHIGLNDPVVWKVDCQNGKLIDEEVIKLNNSPAFCNGFAYSNNSLFILVNDGNSNSQILKKSNLTID